MNAANNHRRLVGVLTTCHAGIVVAASVFGVASFASSLKAGSPAPRHRGHHCEYCKGVCGPHCPVRPGVYGFYGTQWRQWPGQGFMSSQQAPAATPAMPPRMSVPGPDEESMKPRSEDALVPVPEPSEPQPELETLTPPVRPEPDPEPEARKTPPPSPAPLPVTPPSNTPEDENLFNTRYRPKSIRKLSIGLGGTKPQNDKGEVQAVTHVTPADRRAPSLSVPKVHFDPAAEVRELRIRIK